jgi:hypothetical protein
MPLDDVDKVEHHATFGTHNEIEIAQPDVEIHHDDLFSGARQRGAKRCS